MKAAVTPREAQIWDLVVQGFTKKEIAVKLNRSYHTVNQLYRNLYFKLHIRKETDLVREWFVYHSIVTADEMRHFFRHHAAPAIISFLMITAAQVFFETPAVRSSRTTASRTISRTARSGRRRKRDYHV